MDKKHDNKDFATALTGLRVQAAIHNIDANDENMRRFLIQTAEVIASERVQIREYENIIQRYTIKVGEQKPTGQIGEVKLYF